MIRSKPSTDVYRDAWERVFGGMQVGERVVWHAPRVVLSDSVCDCSRAGVVEQLHASGYVNRVKLDSGEVIDPSVDSALLQRVGQPCAWYGPHVGASVD